jgi:hypothetical protein
MELGMFSKVFTIAAAAAALSATAAYAEMDTRQAPAAACAATSFRVYFEPGATTLNSDAQALVGVATREVAGCADVNVAMAPSTGEGSQEDLMRRASIAAAMRQHGLDVTVPMPHMARYARNAAPGPDYIEVRMTPDGGMAS